MILRVSLYIDLREEVGGEEKNNNNEKILIK